MAMGPRQSMSTRGKMAPLEAMVRAKAGPMVGQYARAWMAPAAAACCCRLPARQLAGSALLAGLLW